MSIRLYNAVSFLSYMPLICTLSLPSDISFDVIFHIEVITGRAHEGQRQDLVVMVNMHGLGRGNMQPAK